jgi:hypothetical protein
MSGTRSQASGEILQTKSHGGVTEEKNHQIAHRRIVAGRGILRNRGRNNNSPATTQSKRAAVL